MLKEKVLKTINTYGLIETNDTIVVGVSGGPDSTCLLNILLELQEELKINIVVAHINHGIRKDAIIDEEYVKNMCEKNNLKCFIKRVDLNKISGEKRIGTEEAGRIIRYEFFDEVAKKVNANKIATAHTKNDQVETVLMNIIRGAGTSGLTGIKAIRENKFIRPLIECERTEIEEYCKEKKLEPKMDYTNKENIYTRNKIRNLLIPYLQKEFNPNIIEAIDRLSNIAKEENEYFEAKVKNTYKEILIEENNKNIQLDLKKFNSLELVIKNRIVLYTINRLLGSSSGIEKIHIQDIIKLCSNNIGNKFLIPNKKIKILVKNKKIFFIPNK